MSIVLALLAASAQPVEANAREEQILVIGKRLQDWRGRFRIKHGRFYCVTRRSTGDAEIDAIGCTALEICYRRIEPRVNALFRRTGPQAQDRAAKQAAKADLNKDLAACLASERNRLIDALYELRSSAR